MASANLGTGLNARNHAPGVGVSGSGGGQKPDRGSDDRRDPGKNGVKKSKKYCVVCRKYGHTPDKCYRVLDAVRTLGVVGDFLNSRDGRGLPNAIQTVGEPHASNSRETQPQPQPQPQQHRPTPRGRRGGQRVQARRQAASAAAAAAAGNPTTITTAADVATASAVPAAAGSTAEDQAQPDVE